MRDWQKDYQKLKKEYADFVYSIAHDYGAPVRHIRSFTRLLIDKHKNHFDSDDLKFKAFIEEGFSKITHMQAILAEYVELEDYPLKISPYHVSALINNACEELKLDGKDLKIQLDDGSIDCDKTLIIRLVIELITNALKFRTTADPISIRGYKKSDCYVLEFLNMTDFTQEQNYEDAFRLFRVMNNTSNTNAYGAGLAFVKKIIDMHGNMHINLSCHDNKQFMAKVVIENL